MTDVCHSAKYVAAAIASGAIVQKVKAVVPSDTLHTEDFQHALATHLVEFGATTKLQTPALTALCETVLKVRMSLVRRIVPIGFRKTVTWLIRWRRRWPHAWTPTLLLHLSVIMDSSSELELSDALAVSGCEFGRPLMPFCSTCCRGQVRSRGLDHFATLMCSTEWWQQKSILELGSGTGLLGLSLCCAFDAAPASYIFTDLPGSVTDNLEHNVQLSEVPSTEVCFRVTLKQTRTTQHRL